MKKQIISVIILVIVSIQVKAQCSIGNNLSLVSGYKIYATERERIYQNEDLENGVFSVSIRFTTLFKDSISKAPIFYLDCYITSSTAALRFAPRKLVINDQFALNAIDKFDNQYIRDLTILGCRFQLGQNDMELFKNKSIYTIQVSDPVYDAYKEVSVKPKVIQNLYNCITDFVTRYK